MKTIELLPGRRYRYQRHVVRLHRVLDLHTVTGEYEATGALDRFPIRDLKPLEEEGKEEIAPAAVEDLLHIPEKAWQRAQQKLAALRPILDNRGSRAIVLEVARQENVSPATVYRWLRAYEQTGSVRSLVEQPRTGGKGKARLDADLDRIIREAIETHYLTLQRQPASKVVLAVRQACLRAGLNPPGVNTIRRRIRDLSEEEKVRRRWGRKQADQRFKEHKGEFPGADYPLAVVQIDHTRVDLILVDEQYRQPVGRPWLTIAVDVFSRMVLGFYLAFEAPGATGTGLCLAHAILPKELWLSRMNVQGDWPCWGVPQVLHADNAKEFRGVMLQRAAEKYGVRIEWRPVGKAHWGGHIERLMGTFMQEVHALAGTTFSNVQQRKDYPSEKKAALTLRELEQWLTLFIVDVYHRRTHQGIHQSPYDRYREGILGSPRFLGTGLPERIFDELQVRLDFMPAEERTIQEYGVVIDHVHYYADVLRPYIHSVEVSSGKARVKRKFTFKRDPRDISCLYFLEPETGQYHRIPYRNTSLPPISVWEFRAAQQAARATGHDTLDEQAIFTAYDKMRQVELDAVARTRRMSKARNRMQQGVPTSPVAVFFQQGATMIHNVVHAPTSPAAAAADTTTSTTSALQPFDGLYDDASFTPEHGDPAGAY